MQIAYPVLNGEFCKHFNHASHFNVIDEQGISSALIELPTKTGLCSANHSWPALLKQANVERIVVQFIGQRMLDRFLNAGFTVDQAPRRTHTIDSAALSATTRLAAGEGHVSPKFEKRQKEGNHCCHGTHHTCASAGGCQH